MKMFFIRILSIMLILSITVTSCLKDSEYDNGQIQSVANGNIKVIGLGLSVTSSSNFVTISVDASNSDTTFNIVPVTLGGPSAAPSDIHVTLALNDTLVSQYDTANGTTYTVPASSIYSFPNGLVVTIPKGSRTGMLAIKCKPNDLLPGPYALGFTITGIAESGYVISGNYNSGIVALGVKNQYDGQYGLTIKTVGWDAYGIADGVTNVWPGNISLVTSGVSSVTTTTSVGGVGSLQFAFTATGSVTGFGATMPQFTFDPSSNKLTAVTNLAAPDARQRAFHINPAVTTSRFDPATRTIYAAYIMTQLGRPDQQIYDTLNYVGPR